MSAPAAAKRVTGAQARELAARITSGEWRVGKEAVRLIESAFGERALVIGNTAVSIAHVLGGYGKEPDAKCVANAEAMALVPRLLATVAAIDEALERAERVLLFDSADNVDADTNARWIASQRRHALAAVRAARAGGDAQSEAGDAREENEA